MTTAPGNQASAGHLLRLIRSGQATTRGELQRATGLSRSTVSNRLEQLFGAGWLRVGVGASTGGRPSTRLEFDTGHAVVLAADVQSEHGRAAVLDLSGRILAERAGPMDIEDGPDRVLERLAQGFAPLLAETGVPADRVCGVGLSVPGPVEFETGEVVQPPIMPGWDRFPIRERLSQALARHLCPPATAPPPVLVDNDANLMALAEQRAGYPASKAFLLVKVSTGIGAGVMVNGEVYRGTDGGAGDIGHIKMHDHPDARCMCGSHGCLAAVASGRALAAKLTAAGVPASSGSELRALLAAGHPDAVRLAREAGQRAGEVLVTVVTLLNPGILMIAGDLAVTPFLTGVRELLYQRAMPRTSSHLRVVTSVLGERAGLAGAAIMVVERLYAPEQADARLASTLRERTPAS